MTKQADVVVIGGGITGTAILHELAKYNLRAVLVEQNRNWLPARQRPTVPSFTQVSMRLRAV